MTKKKTWGRSNMYYCPIKRKVWQEQYNANTKEMSYIIHHDMPTYGLKRKPMEDS